MAVACEPESGGRPAGSQAVCLKITAAASKGQIHEDFAGFPLKNLLRSAPHPYTTMKKLLLLPLVALAFVASSCRTMAPIDPMTMKPSDRCLPGHASGYSGK